MNPQSFSVEYLSDILRITVGGSKNLEVVRNLRRWIRHAIVRLLLGIAGFSLLLVLFVFLRNRVLVGTIIAAIIVVLAAELYHIVLAIYLRRRLGGLETLDITPQGIQVRVQKRHNSRTEQYFVEDIVNLYVAEARTARFAFSSPWANVKYLVVSRTGPIAFRYRGRLIHIGLGIDPEEAKDIIAIIRKHFSQYQ